MQMQRWLGPHGGGGRKGVAIGEVSRAQRRKAAHHVQRQPNAIGSRQPCQVYKELAGLRNRFSPLTIASR